MTSLSNISSRGHATPYHFGFICYYVCCVECSNPLSLQVRLTGGERAGIKFTKHSPRRSTQSQTESTKANQIRRSQCSRALGNSNLASIATTPPQHPKASSRSRTGAKTKLQRAGFEPATPCCLQRSMGSRYPTTGLTMLFV